MNNGILYIAIITSIAGLILLTYGANVLEPGVIEISKLNMEYENYLYKNVHIRGEIIDLKNLKGNLLLTIDDKTENINVFLPGNAAKKTEFSKGDFVDVVGTLEIYNDDLEIVVNDYKHIREINETARTSE